MALKSFSVFTSFKAKDGMSPVFQNMKNKASGFSGQINKIKSQTQTLNKSFGGMKAAIGGVVAAATTGAVVTTLNSWVDKASDLQETLGKTNETFKADSNAVIEWSKNSIKSMGLAQQTALDTAALYGDMGSGMGMTTKRASKMATSLTQLSADIASFKNVDQSLSANALKGIFTGETEALKNLGVVMNETNLQEYAKRIGVGGKLKNMTQAQKIELRYKYVMDSTKNAQGDFLRTGGNYANQSRMFEEQKKQLETNLGAIMLPKYNSVMKSLNSILINYAPVIEKGFGSLFKNFEEGLKICSPLFDKFKNLFKTFSTTIFPMFQRSVPIIKTLLSTVVVPALGLVIDSLNGLFKTLSVVFSFLKLTAIPIISILITMVGAMGLKSAITGATAALKWYNAVLMVSTKQGIMAISGFSKLKFMLSSYTNVVWASVKAIKAQTIALLTNPWVWIPLAIGAVIGAVILLWKNWDKVTATITSWWNSTKTFLAAFWKACKEVFGKIGAFIKDNFLSIILTCLGPVGFIIQSLLKLPSIIKQLKSGGGIKIEGMDGKDVQQKQPKVKGNKNGSIEVKTTIDNRTGYNAQTSTSLQSPNGLSLKPA